MTSPERNLTVAVAQIASVLGDVAANRRKHLDVIDAARSGGVDVLVFPEMSLTGHAAGPDTLSLALRRDKPVIAEIARASGAMCTVFGVIEEGPAAQFYNAAITVRDGAVLAVHRKINLATYGRLEDGKHFAAGSCVETFDLATDWRASVMICADLWNPALVHLAAIQGATLLLAPISSAIEAVGADFDNPAGWDVNLRFYALIYGLPIAMANRVGREGELTFWGGSRIVDSFGRTLTQAKRDAEDLVRARVDFDEVRRARFLLPTVRDANLPLLQREIERIARRSASQVF
ncbi:MAG TPA: nitrilase-related carbon-nitrogen hydrolase [Casimicrobiaceae bacterium]